MRFARLSAFTVAVLAAVLPLSAGTVEGTVNAQAAVDKPFVIFIDDIEGPFPPPARPAVMDQKGLRFTPHVLPIVAGTMVAFPNNDPLLHNVFSISEAKRFNLGLYGNRTARSVRFDKAGVVQLQCNVHQEMSAYIVVLKNPYFTVAAAGQRFRIANVPPGRHRVRCWQEELGTKDVTVEVPERGSVKADCAMGR
ncbi:MAG TPA: hypothetical protein VFU76_03560 [Terriglobales bacterium]|nr:hypothetical protein [Terriglobales bacterium]